MKAIIEFDLSDPDDAMSHMAAVKANSMALVIWNFLYNTRKTAERKIQEEKIDSYEVLDYLMERFSDLLDEYDINIDELTN